MRLAPLALVAAFTAAAAAGAQTPTCDALEAKQRRTAAAILAGEHLWECCDDTIAECLAARPPSRLAALAADEVCRRVAAGHDEARIRRALSRRARSMVGGEAPAAIDLAAAPVVGAAEAPVTVVLYACARCPYCSQLIPKLYEEVEGGSLRGAARLAFRIFPIRGHAGSTEAGLGFGAAAAMGGFWPFMLEAYGHFDEFTPARQSEWAAAAGLDREVFTALLADPTTREAVVAAKKEGLVNGVEETPTVFLNGRHWVGELELPELVSAIREEAARVKGELCVID